MHFYKEFLAAALEREDAHIVFPQLTINANEIIQNECYKALSQIRDILEEGDTDEDTLAKIEEVVQIFWNHDVFCGNQYDY